jgi:hypothetical protein
VAWLGFGTTGCDDRLIDALIEDKPRDEAIEPLSDMIVFGDPASESEHGLEGLFSETIVGEYEKSARRLLPREPADIYGGDVSFEMRVDPGKQNYFTVKLWGSDFGGARLLLYCEGLEVGYRHLGDHEVMVDSAEESPFPGRFYYSTVMLPLGMTLGRDEVKLRILASGSIAPFEQSDYAGYQKFMSEPTGGFYRAYTHVDPFLDPSGEPQSAAPTPAVRPSSDGDPLQAVKDLVDATLLRWLDAPSLRPHETLVLAQAYRTPWSAAFGNALVLDRVISEIDRAAGTNERDPTVFSGGLRGSEPLGGVVDPEYPEPPATLEQLKGAGPYGAAVDLVHAELSTRLEELIELGEPPVDVPRRDAWADLLIFSRDRLRTSSRGQLLPEHELLVDTGIYQANLGLRRLRPEAALSEDLALRYLHEGVGALPASGNDSSLGSELPFGDGYHLVTGRGLGRSLGYASDHGELVDRLVYLWELTFDPVIREQALTMARARAYFRYPALDSEGYRAMRLEGPISYRRNVYPGAITYADRRGELGGAAAFRETDLVGYVQQALRDNQFWNGLQRVVDPTNMERLLALPDRLAAIEAEPASAIRLPMTDGEPDFAWADEEAGVVALKQGVERLYVSLFYRAPGVTGVARVHHILPEMDRIATVQADVQFESSGRVWLRPDAVDWMPGGSLYEPPDRPHQAYAGERSLLAAPPAGVTDTRPFSGRASFYRLRYGRYLVGMNTTDGSSHELTLPHGVTRALDLVSRETLRAPVVVSPRSTVILLLPDVHELYPVPPAPRFFVATAGESAVTLDWDPVPCATSYELRRRTSASSYGALATSLTESDFVDRTVTSGASYRYVVTARNANGESRPSPEVSATIEPAPD